MTSSFYLTEFKKAADSLDSHLLAKKKLEVRVGVWLESVVLKLQKKTWANKPFEQPQTDAAIFFSIWLNDKAIKENKLLYNIHALKLRQLQGYKITSREFATAFRTRFRRFEHLWSNVSTKFGPLTLMEGWEKYANATLHKNVLEIATQFLEIDFLIDELLDAYKK